MTETALRPTMLVKLGDNANMTPLPIEEYATTVQIIRNFAYTKLFLKFYNETDRVLEGQFVFPLSEGKMVSGYALEIEGKFRDAVVVEKAKGRQVFETTIRQKIDPGLLELTRGNVFQSRIYPIPAKGYKSIILYLEEELTLKENGWAFQMPFLFQERIENFSLDIDIKKQAQKPVPYKNELEPLVFEKTGESYRAKFQSNHFAANQQVGFLIPREDTSNYPLVQSKQNGKNYFYFSKTQEVVHRPKKLPTKICILWDASSSAKQRDIEGEFALLREYLGKIENLSVEIVLFSFWIHSTRTFTIQNFNTDEIFTYLREVKYDGGTQLGVLDLNQYECDEFLLFSDGVSNFGESELILTQTPLFAVNSSLTAEHSYLDYISKKSGGAYLNLKKLSFVDSFKILTNRMYSFLSVNSSDSVQEVYPSLPTIVSKEISFAGMFTGDKASLTLNFGFGNEIIHTQKVEIDKNTSPEVDVFLDKIFAQKKIAELDLNYKKNKAEITSLGKEFSIVTRNTSLLVLDRLEDYVNNQIIPPFELQKEYFELLKQKEEEKIAEQKNHLDEIAEKFQTHIDWWNKDFTLPKKDSSKKKGARREMLDSPSPLSSMPSEPEGEESVGDSFEDENISLSDYETDALLGGILTGAGDEPESNQVSRNKTKPAIGSISLQKWTPNEAYLNQLKSASDQDMYSLYLKEKESNFNSSAFYLDVADLFLEKNQSEIALRILSNLAEMNLENHQLLRILGYRLLQIKQWKFAFKIFEDVLEIREEEPQSYRDLALAHIADKNYQKALDLFYFVIQNSWDSRFPDIQLIVIHEMNAMIATCNAELNLETIDKRLLKNLPVDLRVILTWDADNTDLDLWVTDPTGEKCYYGLPLTQIGGRMSQDFRAGYGPEEFLLKKAIPGKYIVEVNFFGSTQQILSATTTLQVTLFTNFGRPSQEDKSITLRLKDVKDLIPVGEFEMGDKLDVT